MKDNRPSATAILIARSLWLMSFDPSLVNLVPPRTAETSGWFLDACNKDATQFRYLARQSWFRRLLFWIERSTTPGLVTHYALRKRQIEGTVRERLATGANQVVVLGAGFDTLAWRLHGEFPDVQFWELDHPATQKAKRAALEAHEPPRDNLHFIAINLASDRLGDAILREPEYQSAAPTVFVAEGLLMYLHPERVSEIFHDAYEASGPKSVFAFTFLAPQADGRTGFARSSRYVDWWLSQRGEPFRWGLAETEAESFLDKLDWRLREIHEPIALRRRYLPDEPLQPTVGDLIGVAAWK